MIQIICRLSTPNLTIGLQRNVSTTSMCLLDRKWRAEKGLPENPNAFGPLTNLPDYTFMDGRPTPMAANLKKRLLKQQEVAKRIVELNKELEFAKERYTTLQKNKQIERENILKNKLKPKGHLLLKK